MIVVTRTITDSFRGDLETWVRAYIGGDLFITSSSEMDASLGRQLEVVPGVAAVAPVRYLETAWARAEGDVPLMLMATDPQAYARVTRFALADASQDQRQVVAQLDAGDSVLISGVVAEKYGVTVGDTVILRTARGPRDFRIAGQIVDFSNQGLVVQTSWLDMRKYFGQSRASVFLVKVQSGASIANVRQDIDEAYGRRYHLTIESNVALVQRVLQLMEQASGMFDVMALIAMLVAAFGVVNTLTVSVIERTQEIGMLRSVGMTGRQVVSMVLAEAGLMGLVGGGLGIVLGLLLSRIFLLAMGAMSGYRLTFVIPWQGLLAGLLSAWLVTQLAAALPARRAIRIRLLEAIQYE